MGREIRRVPPHWEHPTDENGEYISLFDDYKAALQDHVYNYEYALKHDSLDEFFEDGFPDPNDYVHYAAETATWYQMYENTSEGTPVTPPFETEEELITHLCTKGTFYFSTPWDVENARAFVKVGFAASFLITSGRVYTAENMGELKK